MGPIVDRSQEHLGTTDRAIIAMRQLLLEAIDALTPAACRAGSIPRPTASVRPVDRLLPKGTAWRDALKEDLVARF